MKNRPRTPANGAAGLTAMVAGILLRAPPGSRWSEQRRSTVVLETPQVSVWEEPLPSGTKIVHPVGGASISPRAFNVDLDTFSSVNPVVHLSGDGGEPISGPLSWSLQKNEVEQILIRVCASGNSLFHWEARLPVLIDGERRFLTINDNSSPITFAGGTVDGWKHWDGTRWVST